MVLWELRQTKLGTMQSGRSGDHEFQLTERGGWQLAHRIKGDSSWEHLATFDDEGDAKYAANQWVSNPNLQKVLYGE